MKQHNQQTLLILLPLFMFACNNAPKIKEAKNDETTKEMNIMIPNQTCYAGTIGRDSIFLKIEKFPNVVTGRLEYKFYEKDNSVGEIDGVMSNDTLVADYRFTTEGKQSVTQVIFLLQGDFAIEGYGEKEEKEGKTVFKNRGQISFENSIRLNKTACY
jgi:hypothetical protein